MNYTSYEYYKTGFFGNIVPEDQFDYLSSAATDIIFAMITKNEPYSQNELDVISKAVAYQTELLYLQGGAEAIAGLAISTSGLTEKAGDCSVGMNYSSLESNKTATLYGIPVSGIAISILKRAGLTNRCVFDDRSYLKGCE